MVPKERRTRNEDSALKNPLGTITSPPTCASLDHRTEVVLRRGVADLHARPTVRPQKLALGVLARSIETFTHERSLCPPLTEELCAELGAALLRDLLASLSILPMGHRSLLSVEGEPLTPPTRWQLVLSASNRMEERLDKGFVNLFSTGAESAAIVRGDVPLPPLDELFEGMLWLTKHRRLLLGPTNQGGFYLVGTTHNEPELFKSVDWSKQGVIERAKARAEKLGIEVQIVKPADELKEPGDLKKLALAFATSPPALGVGTPQSELVLKKAGIKP